MKRSASLLIINEQGKLLLLQRGGESKRFLNFWEFPGGKIDEGETAAQAVVREVREEAGLKAELSCEKPLWVGTTGNREVEYSFFVWKTGGSDPQVVLSGEHTDYEWVSVTEARKLQMMPIHREFLDRFWHQEQMEAYERELPHYIAYRIFLEKLLNRLKSRWAPLAIVQAREKNLSSFAEKCVRKADKYDDPVHQLTDLCGARVIGTTIQEVDIFIRQLQQLFAVDELDDTRRRHEVAEFGYLSVHFIVHVPEGVKEMLGIPVPQEIGSRKAEIQVRTMLQHAHSEVTHDRLYKSGFNVPEPYRREAARVAAQLESADAEFAAFVSRLDAYVGNYSAHLSRDKRIRAIEDLKLVLQHERALDKKPLLALRIARIARAGWDWPELLAATEPFLGIPSPHSDCLRMEAGHALCQVHQQNPEAAEFQRGIDLLSAVGCPNENADACLECDERDRRATALGWLGWAYSRKLGHRKAARACFEKAVELAPDNPYHFTAFIELDLIASGSDEYLSLLAPSLRQAAGKCEEHILAGIEVTRAWLTLAKLRLLLDDPCSAFEALCLGARCAETHPPMQQALHSFQQLQDAIGNRRKSLAWFCAGAVLLAAAKEQLGNNDSAERKWNSLSQRYRFDPDGPVIIFGGATSEEESTHIAAYAPMLEEALSAQKATLISGGTTAGICGLVARVASRLNADKRASLEMVGYVPERVPKTAAIDPAYGKIVRTEGTDVFSAREPIQMWEDLLASGIKPSEVRLFCLGGGELSAIELALAWALGAKAAAVNDGSLAATRFAKLLKRPGVQTGWGMILPDDPATLKAYFLFDRVIDDKQWEKSGEAVHEAYVASQQKTLRHSTLAPWQLLRDDFKHSNRHQAACAVEILRRCGFQVESTPRAPGQISLIEFTDSELERLAEWEHGRWTCERLNQGWRYGEKKDEAKKLSPYLVSWQELSEAIKNYDREAAREWPGILAKAGWTISRT